MYKRLVCTTKDKLNVYEVKGREVRDNVNTDFALGCHDLRCPYVPKDEVWVEQLQDPVDMCFNLGHELIERFLMDVNIGPKPMTYNRAHGIALAIEARERKTGECKPCGELLSSEMKDHILELWPILIEPGSEPAGGRCGHR